MNRRSFLGGAVAVPLAVAQGLPLPSSGIRLGIDAYSIRGLNWKALQLVEYASSLKLDVLQFSNLGSFESLDPAHLQKVREAAAGARIGLELGLGSICETSTSWRPTAGLPTPIDYLRKGIEVASALGAPNIKAYLGASPDRLTPVPLARHIDETLKTLKAVRSLAVDKGVKIAMENHSGDLQARELRDLIEAAGKDWVGCNLDSGNPMLSIEEPQFVLEMLGPYTLTTHIRDSVIFEHPRGAAWQWVALGDGCAVDWARFVTTFQKLCPNAPFLLENITGRPPRVTPYHDPEFWKAFPNARAADFAGFVRLAREGRPLMTQMVIGESVGTVPEEYRAAMVQQQRYDFERGIAFAQKQLGLGVNCRAG